LSHPFLSVIIPAYNEEVRIAETLEQVAAFLGTRNYSWEVVVANDGSSDATAALAAQFAGRHPEIRLLNLEHRGKGWAVKEGVLTATGEYRFICDADLSMPIEQVERFLPPGAPEVDIAIGSREMPDSRRIGEPVRRHLMGRFYNLLIRWLAVRGIRDTQCGFKCFRGAIAEPLFRQQTLDGFAFDVELLYIARRSGLSLREVGIDWRYRGHSKVRAFQDSALMTWDLLKIRWRHRGFRRLEGSGR
jgi:glycosyltransferase involved in cell wall biosynthesis